MYKTIYKNKVMRYNINIKDIHKLKVPYFTPPLYKM